MWILNVLAFILAVFNPPLAREMKLPCWSYSQELGIGLACMKILQSSRFVRIYRDNRQSKFSSI